MKIYESLCYNNIIVFNHILKKYIKHFYVIFQILDNYCISFFLKKFYLSYFIIALLSQKVDIFKLFTATDKLKTIMKLKFLYMLKMLKIYLSLIK